MLRRLGNKTRLLPKLLPLFPENINMFVDMFMGSGAVTFAMVDRAKYIIANDKDEDVFNLFLVIKEHKEELENAIRMIPTHDALFQYWKKQEEHDCVWRAARFLMMSNFGYLGKQDFINTGLVNPKKCLLEAFKRNYAHDKIKYLNKDFRELLPAITFRKDRYEKPFAFIYADPPYIGKTENYRSGFTKKDTIDLFEVLVSSGIRFALSEFASPFVLELAVKHGLYVTEIGERRTLKNRNVEVLITNYELIQNHFLLFQGMSLN